MTEISRTLIKTDKNGTEYYEVVTSCTKCNGTGYIGYYHWNEGGRCFECGGTGRTTHKEKKMLPEYEAKLEARRAARAEKRLAEAREAAKAKNLEFFEKSGFNGNGKTFVIVGNTYDIKEEIKANGGKWINDIKCWIIPDIENIDTSNMITVVAKAEEIYENDYYTNLFSYRTICEESGLAERIDDAKAKLEKALAPMKEEKLASQKFFMNVGEKFKDVTVTFVNYRCFDGFYGETFYHTFETEDGCTLVWKTGNDLGDIEIGSKVTISGSVKEHNIYKETKQTIVTRCKVK